jgi:hypothetical protein
MADPVKPPPLEDPLNEKEIFAREVAGVGMVHGNVVLRNAGQHPL